mmetsp:Transcript_11616/g.22904  ORF Transcript_11616/g.22904 Transcript_11616/m.22904 type:complete len:721 (+) Transcript_11616:176-2338(+)
MDNGTTIVDEESPMSFWTDNIVPVVVTTGCVTLGLLGTLLAVKSQSKNRSEDDPLDDDAENAAAQNAGKNGEVNREKYPGGKLTVYFATQTGTAEAFAKELQREGKDHGFLVRVEDPDTLDSPEHMADRESRSPFGADSKPDEMPRAIILAATYGEGEPTDNSTELFNQMEEYLENDEEGEVNKPLLGLEYAVFGLGNTEYEIFNAMGKFFDTALEKLGGTRVYDLGLGDDSDDLEGDFEKWREGMWATLKKRYVKDGAVVAAESQDGKRSLPDCEYSIRWEEEESVATATYSDQNRASVPLETICASSKHYFTAVDCPVPVVRELRSPEDGGSTVHVEIDISNANIDYQTADNLGVLPCNAQKVVESVAESLGYTQQLDKVFSVVAGTNQDGEEQEWHGLPFPTPITVRECFTRYLDLTSAPHRSDLKLLSSYAKEAADRKTLQHLSSKEGKEEYKKQIVEGKMGLSQLLKLCPSLEIPLEHLIGNVCRFQLARFYTIASCPKVHPKSIHLTVAVTKEERPDGSSFEGVCSTHIAGGLDQSLRVFVRPSTFRLPPKISTPILMIGPGTGIAPMRALLQDRKHQFEQEGGGTTTHTHMHNVLYFGCKKEELDYIYREELEGYHNDGTLKDLHLAFSRKDPTQKEYVQHLLRKNAASTYTLLKEQGAYVFVCGGVKMGHDVTETLKEILVEESNGSMSQDAAANYLTTLSSEGRFVQELWS